jgi:hypothetical protein
MRLTKAQLTIVEQMRKGSKLYKSSVLMNSWWMPCLDDDTVSWSVIRYTTANSLIKQGVIACTHFSTGENDPSIYELTEKYRKNEG